MHTFENHEPITDAHTGPDTALTIADYPYGFRERTQIRYWVEYKKSHGFRKVSQTLNPKTGRWNKPKAGTYYPVMVLYRETDTGHIQAHTLGTWETEADIAAFETHYAAALTDTHRREIRALRVLNRAAAKLTVEVRAAEPGEDYAVHRAEQARVWQGALNQAAREVPA